MRPRQFPDILRGSLIPLVFLTMAAAAPSLAGRNAGGALIVHTDDAVNYTSGPDYCATSFLPASCEAAFTRTDKDEDTPAVIWMLGAFPETSSPGVTAAYFGLDHNLSEDSFVRWHMCGELELPDAGWPATGGNAVAFGSVMHTERLFPVYWFAALGAMGSHFGTSINPVGGYAVFVDDNSPPEEDVIANFGRVEWGADGYNICPSAGGMQSLFEYPLEDSHFVWALHLADSTIEIPVNRFVTPSYQKQFPSDSILLHRLETAVGDPWSTGVAGRALSIPVFLNYDGQVIDSLEQRSAGPVRDLSKTVSFRFSRTALDRLHALQLQLSGIVGASQFPREAFTVLRFPEQTVIVNERTGEISVQPFVISEPSFSSDGSRAAAATKDGRIVIFDPQGRIVLQTEQSTSYFGQVHIDPGGKSVMYVREPHHGPSEGGILDLETGQLKAELAIPEGPRYYSADGSRLLVVDRRAAPGHAIFFDVSNPFAPAQVAAYSATVGITTASVSDDGSKVAIQQDEDDGGVLSRVILLDGLLQPVGGPLVTNFPSGGVQFEGKYLFVGVQRHPLPAYLQGFEAKDVLLYDLSF